MLGSRISDHDVERLLCGEMPENRALKPLAPMLIAFHDITWPAPTEEAVARFASEAAPIARSATGGAMLKPSPPARRSRFLIPAIQRGLATGLAGVLLLSGLAGVAIASDESAPGDLLYGLDRAVESIGVGAGGASERISEAWALFDRGQVAEAVSHASEAVDVVASADPDDPAAQPAIETPNAADALRSAAGRVGAGIDDGTSLEMKAAVAAMLSEMAAMLEDTDLEGKDFGQNVAEIASLIGANDSSSVPDHTGPGKPGPGNSEQAPADPPGKSDSSPGKSDENPPTRP